MIDNVEWLNLEGDCASKAERPKFYACADELTALRALVDEEIKRLRYLRSINNDRGTSEANWLASAEELRK